jgi:hypothetical protein
MRMIFSRRLRAVVREQNCYAHVVAANSGD